MLLAMTAIANRAFAQKKYRHDWPCDLDRE
jgi:hypothetical protein